MSGTSQLSYAFVVFISAIFTQNILLSYFLGLCPFIGVSREVKTSFGLGLAVIFVINPYIKPSLKVLAVPVTPVPVERHS